MYCGLDHRGRPVRRGCTIVAGEVWNPPTLHPPRPRQFVNCEVLQVLNDSEITDGLGGVVCLETEGGGTATDSASPTVDAFFCRFQCTGKQTHFCGLGAVEVRELLAQALAAPAPAAFPSLELEVGEVPFADARKALALPTSPLDAIAVRRPLRRTVLTVRRLLHRPDHGAAAAAAGLRVGDALLCVAGVPLAGASDLRRAL